MDILSLSFLSFVYHLNSPSVGNIAKVSPLASHLALASYQLMNSLWSCRHVLAMGFNTYSGGHGAMTADSAAGDSSSSSMTISFAKKGSANANIIAYTHANATATAHANTHANGTADANANANASANANAPKQI